MYASILNNTQTPAHTIAPVAKEPATLAEKLSSAKGTGLTGTAIKKVANFIGMDEAALAIEPAAPIRPGMLSVDLELEAQARRQSSQRIAALEQAEQLRRLTLPEAEMKRKVLAIFTSRRVQNDLAMPTKRAYDRGVSPRFLKYIRATVRAIEEAEKSRRMEDKTGELIRRELAKEVTFKVIVGLQSPQLRDTKHMINAPWPTEYNSALNVFGGAALEAGRHLATSAAVSAYQIADFALRVGKFFGPKAIAKGSELSGKAISTGQVMGDQAIQTGKVLGHTALEKTQSLSHTAAEKTRSLGQTALEKTQSLGHQAVSGAQTIGHQAVSGAQTLGNKATDAVVNTAVGAQHLTEQAIQTAKDLKDQTQSAVVDAVHAVQDWATTPEPSLSWTDVESSEEAERQVRNADNFNPSRLMLAMRTSALVRDRSMLYPMGSPSYGMRVLEEMERFDRRSNQTYARANSNKVASLIDAHRQKWINATQSHVAVALTEATKSAPLWASGLANTSVGSARLAPEMGTTARSLNQSVLSAPTVQATPAAVYNSAQSPFVSQTAMDAFSKAFQQQAPVAVYRPAM